MYSAELIFQQAGLKSTASRLTVTAVLVNNNFPLTHQDLLKQLPDDFDRVTLYRVLDWLLQHGLIHRIAGEDRAWRFQLNAIQLSHIEASDIQAKNIESTNIKYSEVNAILSAGNILSQHAHAHFQCSECSKIFCLDNIQPKLSGSIPTDFTIYSIELNIKGKCASCQK